MPAGRPRKQTGLGLPKNVYLKYGAFYYVHRGPPRRWERLGKDLAEAEAKAKAYAQDSPLLGTLAYFWAEWLKATSQDRAARTNADYKEAGEALMAVFGRMHPGALRPTHVAEYLDRGKEAGRSVRANREKAALSSCYSWLVRRGIVDSNPCKGVRRNSESKRDRHISDAEYLAVHALAGPAVRAWMALIYRTLQRPSDILAWTQGNLHQEADGVHLRFRQGKTGRPMSIVVNADILDALAALKAERKKESKYLVAKEDGTAYTESGLAAMFRRHVVAAGLKDFAPYDLKAKGATDMYAAGVPLEVIRDLCGHESVRTTEIYIKTHTRSAVHANSRQIKAPPKQEQLF